jgi:hypothetical protein
MSPADDRRLMRCERCDGEWKTPGARPLVPVFCPYCNVHICACGCGTHLSEMRRDAIYASEAHGKALVRAPSADVAPIRSVAEARAIQEDGKNHWSQIVREGIIDVLRGTGYFHADDLADLGIPDEHRNIIGSQTAKLVNQKWMKKRGERRSINPSRNAAKTGIYKLTDLGRESIVGVGAGNRDGDRTGSTGPRSASLSHASADPGESSAEGRGQAREVAASGIAESADATPGAASPDQGPPSLFEVPPPRPLSAFTDSEAA